MAEIGTYGSTQYGLYTPVNILPEVGDNISWQLLETVSRFSQRFRQMATVVATVAANGGYTFDYSELTCDYFPPFLDFYVYTDGFWQRFDREEDTTNKYALFQNIGLGTAIFKNIGNTLYPFLLMAYL